MSKLTQRGKIPFDAKTGDLLTYVYSGRVNVEWRDNYIFEDSLIYINYELGRSKIHFIMRSLTTDVSYRMTLQNFDSCIRRGNNGVGPIFHGKWSFTKRGCNYSLIPVEDGESATH